MTGGSRRQEVALIVLAVVLVAGLAVGFVRHGRAAEKGFTIEQASTLPQQAVKGGQIASLPVTPAAPVEVVVHVAGSVKKPGVYHLPPAARAEDAIKAAGGATADANQDAINLAAPVEDGQQLYLPSRKEQPIGGAAPAAAGKTASTPHGTRASGGSTVTKLRKPGSGTVDLNKAGATELQRLPGVGPAMAERILSYRKEIGRFTSIEQLMDVSGIGEKKFAKMKCFVSCKAPGIVPR